MKGMAIIKIHGHLDKKWKNRFEGLDILYEGDNTILKGNIKDEAHLHGLLNGIRDLNLKLISVNPEEGSNIIKLKGKKCQS
jgi:hypothetical protein